MYQLRPLAADHWPTRRDDLPNPVRVAINTYANAQIGSSHQGRGRFGLTGGVDVAATVVDGGANSAASAVAFVYFV